MRAKKREEFSVLIADQPKCVASRDGRYKWVALSNTTLGVLMAGVDSSIIIISLPAIFRGINLDPLAPGNVSHLLWMIMGYRLISAVLVVTLRRLGDVFGRVRMYNLGFAVFSAASAMLSLDPLTGSSGALWLNIWRIVQALGGAMLTANSAAILTDAFPTNQRGMALGINQIAGISGQFIGLGLGGLLAVLDWRAVFWVNVPAGLIGTIWAYRSLREISVRQGGCIDWRCACRALVHERQAPHVQARHRPSPQRARAPSSRSWASGDFFRAATRPAVVV